MIKQLYRDITKEIKKTQVQLYLTSFILLAIGLGLGFYGITNIAIPILIGGIGACVTGFLWPHI